MSANDIKTLKESIATASVVGEGSELRNLSKTHGPNDGSRSLLESILYPEVVAALRDWMKHGHGTIIGGVALSFYVKPRTTEDVDVMFVSEDEIPDTVPGFTRTRDHAFQHNKTHVEIELVTPGLVGGTDKMFRAVRDTAVEHEGISIASPGGLIAMKIGRNNLQDQADIGNLIASTEISLDAFPLTDENLEEIKRIGGIGLREAEAQRKMKGHSLQ